MSKYSREIISECIKLYENGLSLTKIQELKNLDRKELSRDLKEYGISISSDSTLFEEKYLNNQEKIIEEYLKEKNITRVQKKLKLNRKLISTVLKMNKIIDQPEFNDKLSEQISNDYINGLTTRELEKKYQKSRPFIVQLLRYKNIDTNHKVKKEYHFNEQFFSKIDTEEKAYFLGFLYADGNVASQANHYSIEIVLKEEDKHILEQFSEALNLDKKPKLKKVKLNGKIFNSYRLQFSSKKMHSDLIKLGCFPKKSLKLKFPTEEQVPNYLINHFMRGYFDGDGNIYISEDKKKFRFSILGTKNFTSEYQKKIMSLCNLESKTKIYKTGKIYVLQYSGKNQVSKIYNVLYQNQNIYLERKHKKFIAVLGGNI